MQTSGKSRGLKAFEGYCEARRNKDEQPALSSLPYHHTPGIPQEQKDLMDKFFQDMRDQKAERERKAREEADAYDRVKGEYKERTQEDLASGRLEPLGRIFPVESGRDSGEPLDNSETVKKVSQNQSLVAQPETRAAKDSKTWTGGRGRLSREEKSEIDALFEPYEQQTQKELRVQTSREETDTQGERHLADQLPCREPTKFQQAAGEIYCWWTLPPQASGRDVKLDCSQSGSWLTVKIRGSTIFDGKLFHSVKADEVNWYVDSGELHVTMTKAKRNHLWEQLGEVAEIQRDDSGKVIPKSLPGAMSSADRLAKFKEMVEGDDGTEMCYDDLGVGERRLVDAMRRYKHAQATGDAKALYEAEEDLEEFGRLVI